MNNTIFDWDYRNDTPSPFDKFSKLCEFLDKNQDGFADIEEITPKVVINGNDQWTDDFVIDVKNIGITYIVTSNGQYGGYTTITYNSAANGNWMKIRYAGDRPKLFPADITRVISNS